MATIDRIDQLILEQLPALPRPPGDYLRNITAIVLNRDWKYNDQSQDIPPAMQGRMPNVRLVNGRLPLFKVEPGYAFFRGKNTAMVFFIKNSKVISTVLPLSVLTVGVQFRTLTEQTSSQLPAPPTSLTPQVQNAKMALDVKARLQMGCIPMIQGDASVRTFTTYRIRRGLRTTGQEPNTRLLIYGEGSGRHQICFSFQRELSNSTGPKPSDSKFGYLVFEVMDDHKPHPRAWVGVPSVGPYVNFDEASCFAALESRIYTEPRGEFPEQMSFNCSIRRLETDHLNQRYRWLPQTTKTMPAPKPATWDDNFHLMDRRFGTSLTHVITSGRPDSRADFLLRTQKDALAAKSEVKCDTCRYIGLNVKCVREESQTNIWVCKCCAVFRRPCTFTSLSVSLELWGSDPPLFVSRAYSVYPSGPHRFLSYRYTMNLAQQLTVSYALKPLSESLFQPADDDEGEEEMDDVVEESDDE
ncbi:hypothetical protein FLAG1_03416 [Fusarium langsethiae]|uniref:Uncharacterized protein n=1 Tax=Fusarium langsethiae TaxID=179993 RepID=A0A0M9F0U3_FUSLA|nr:hypothetical protein FLAG1_03416 [Fusarium langsethiae]GKU01233.1 unnamed protein product [Fusarium langsethiae]GKU11006.1 unnamed protein product [Fusarium langsethiae]